jgi:Domain of unknown function (DUF5011)
VVGSFLKLIDEIMKNLLRAILVITSAVIGFSCTDLTTDNVSFITTYPIIDLKGPQLIILAKGSIYTETAIATIAGQSSELVVANPPDMNTPGIYTITYTATNKDKFARVAQRQVVVFDPAADAVDLSGQYLRAATGVVANVVKVSPCVYKIDDAGGLGSSFLDVLFVNTSGKTLIIPIQKASSGITVQSVPGTGKINAAGNGFSWVLNADAVYGGSTRTFVKI